MFSLVKNVVNLGLMNNCYVNGIIYRNLFKIGFLVILIFFFYIWMGEVCKDVLNNGKIFVSFNIFSFFLILLFLIEFFSEDIVEIIWVFVRDFVRDYDWKYEYFLSFVYCKLLEFVLREFD